MKEGNSKMYVIKSFIKHSIYISVYQYKISDNNFCVIIHRYLNSDSDLVDGDFFLYHLNMHLIPNFGIYAK